MRSRLFVLLAVAAMLIAACAQPTPTPAPTSAPAQAPGVSPKPTAVPTAMPEPTAVPVATEEPMPTAAPTEVPEAAEGMLPAVNPLEVKGDIITAGSSTVFPLTERIAERFKDEGYAGNITIDSIGSGAGFERFCKAGESDISNASRAIKESEVESCRAIGREPLQVRVGTDALAVVVNPDAGWLAEGVTIEELAKLFSQETTNWSDVNPAWPAQPVKRFSPGTDSGTFDYFVEAVMDPTYVKDAKADKGKGEEMLLAAGNLQLSEDDNVLVQGVEGDRYAIGYFGYAYFQENEGKLQALKINGVAPTAATVDAGEYPLARPLFIYTTAKIMQEKPQVAAFVNFYLTYVNEEIVEVGYFPAHASALDEAKSAWLDAMGMGGATSEGMMLPAVNPLEVKGDIITAGSSTVFPLTERIAERFKDEGYAGNITIDSIGSGAGFERFCKAGESDISNASRAIKESEVESCRVIGREPLQVRVGTDALAVVVNPDAGWLAEGVTIEELAKLFSQETTNWSDVNPAWPAQPVKRFSPGTDSGTFDYFVEAVMDPTYVKDAKADKGKGEEMLLAAGNLQLSEDDNVLVQGVEGDRYAIGYFGYAYFQENEGKLQALKINGVAPTAATVDAGEYPLARPLFIYTTAKIMQEKPQVAAFVNFYLTYVNEEIVEVGYFPAHASALDEAKSAWLEAMK